MNLVPGDESPFKSPYKKIAHISLKLEAFIYAIIMISTLIGIYNQTSSCMTQEYPRDTRGLVSDHHNRESITIKWATRIFWFPNAKKKVYTLL